MSFKLSLESCEFTDHTGPIGLQTYNRAMQEGEFIAFTECKKRNPTYGTCSLRNALCGYDGKKIQDVPGDWKKVVDEPTEEYIPRYRGYSNRPSNHESP
jgi:hypothetical protein